MNPNEAPDTTLLPRDDATGEPLPQTDTPGYYPGYSTLAQQAFWDPATRDVVTMRVEQVPSIRYFNPVQARFWRAVFDHLIPQHDRTPDRRIPLLEPLDLRLYQNRTIGYRYETMPHDREAYRLGEQAINEESQHRYGGDFVDLPQRQQDLVLQAIHDQKPEAAKSIWKQMSIGRFWQLLMQDAIEAYYAHPRGLGRDWVRWPGLSPCVHAAGTRRTRTLGGGAQRYYWLAPRYTVSDTTEATHHLHLESDQNG